MERDEFLDYLKALCESVGVDNDIEGTENPKLALAARIQLKIMEYQRNNRVMHQALSYYAEEANWKFDVHKIAQVALSKLKVTIIEITPDKEEPPKPICGFCYKLPHAVGCPYYR